MYAISVWSPKGGVGKSLISLNLAGAACSRGMRVIVCDADPQGSAQWVASKGKLPFEVVKGIPNQRPDADLIIIDHPPGTDLAPAAKVVIVPIRPSALDYAAAQRAIALLDNKIVVRVVNAVDIRRREEATVAKKLSDEGAVIIKNRSVYPRILGKRETVFSAGLIDSLYGAREAQNEIKKLLDTIMEAFK